MSIKINPFNGSNDDIEKVAQALLDKFKTYFPKPISKNDFLSKIVNMLNGKVSVLKNPNIYEEEGGSLVVNKDRSFIIRLSPSTSPLRDNFTIAHELGHYFLHLSQIDDIGEPIIFNRYGTGTLEYQANRFAAAFLMPATEFKEVKAKFSNNSYLIASHFEVSQTAAETRMEYI